jgi:hypothetical protein
VGDKEKIEEKIDLCKVKEDVMKYLNELNDRRLDDRLRNLVMEILQMNYYVGEYTTTVGYREYKIITTSHDDEDNEVCNKWVAPYVILGDAEMVQIDEVDESQNVQELEWGIPTLIEHRVRCNEVEYETKVQGGYELPTERGKECMAEVKVVPKTPIVLIEEEDDDSCWTYNKRYYLYVHPYGWWTL